MHSSARPSGYNPANVRFSFYNYAFEFQTKSYMKLCGNIIITHLVIPRQRWFLNARRNNVCANVFNGANGVPSAETRTTYNYFSHLKFYPKKPFKAVLKLFFFAAIWIFHQFVFTKQPWWELVHVHCDVFMFYAFVLRTSIVYTTILWKQWTETVLEIV